MKDWSNASPLGRGGICIKDPENEVCNKISLISHQVKRAEIPCLIIIKSKNKREASSVLHELKIANRETAACGMTAMGDIRGGYPVYNGHDPKSYIMGIWLHF